MAMTSSTSTKDISKVNLGKFRLTVGPQVLVAEAAGNLHIAVESCHHGQLFIDLEGD